ncbi:MAG: hypothetical protein WCX31_10590 [Salinivirgaceae bacterium]
MYHGELAEYFDYSYWDGADWSNLIGSRNGIGLVELYGVAQLASVSRKRRDGRHAFWRDHPDKLNKTKSLKII